MFFAICPFSYLVKEHSLILGHIGIRLLQVSFMSCGCYDYHTFTLSGSDIFPISSFFFNSFKDVGPSSFFVNSLGSNNSSNWFLARLGTGPTHMRETKDKTHPFLCYMYSPNLFGDGERPRDS